MKQEKEAGISYWAAHLTTVVSVSLVLLIIGIIALITISARSETRRIREQIELSAVMADSVPDAVAARIVSHIKAQPYALDVALITSAQAMQNWTDDTGVDLEELYGVNPLSPEVSFTLRADYSDEASIRRIASEVRALPGVEDVAVPDASMITAMNRNIEGLSYVLGGIALVLVLISFVLINNTVHLTIHSRRFTIHTMQLVGATKNFIRRPFILNNALAGIIAGVIASGIIAAALALSPSIGIEDPGRYVSWPHYAVIAASLLFCGALICSLAAYIATTRYLRKDYDDLFR